MAEGQAHGPAGEAGEWLNITQAARRLGWPRERLRSLARRGKLATRRMNTGELWVQVTPELVAQAQAEPPPAHRLAERLDDVDLQADPEVNRLLDRVATLEAALAEATAHAAGLRVDVARAEERVKAAAAVATADVEAARRTAEEAIAAHGELLSELRRTLEYERARAEQERQPSAEMVQLKAQLALTQTQLRARDDALFATVQQKPWWRRWFSDGGAR